MGYERTLRQWAGCGIVCLWACVAHAAGPRTPEDCRKLSVAWATAAAEGKPETLRAALREPDFGFDPARQEASATGFAQDSAAAEESLGGLLAEPIELPPMLRPCSDFLAVPVDVRRRLGTDRRLFGWLRGEDGIWRPTSILGGAAARGLADTWSRRVDAADRLLDPPSPLAAKLDAPSGSAADVFEPLLPPAPWPKRFETAADRRTASDRIVRGLAAGDFVGVAKEALAGTADYPIGDAHRADAAAQFRGVLAADLPDGACRIERAEFLGTARRAGGGELLLYSLPRARGIAWLGCEFERRGTTRQLAGIHVGDVPYRLALLAAVRYPDEAATPPPVPVPAPAAARAADAPEWEAEIAPAMLDLAAGQDERFRRMLRHTVGSPMGPEKGREAVEVLRRSDRLAAVGLGEPTGAGHRLYRMRLGRDYLENHFLFEREQGRTRWIVGAFRPTQMWQIGFLGAGPTIQTPRAECDRIVPRPGASPAEPRFAPLSRPFEPAALAPETLKDAADCLQAAAFLARRVSRSETREALREFLVRFGSPRFGPEHRDRMVSEVCDHLQRDKESEGELLRGITEYLGRIEEGPSSVTFCFRLKYEIDNLSLTVGFRRADAVWECDAFYVGPTALKSCLRFAEVEYD